MRGFFGRRSWMAACVAVALAFATGCENPVGAGGEHPEGLVVLTAQGDELARYTHQNRTSTGQITVGPGQTAEFQLALVTRTGARIAIDGLEYSLRAPTVVTAVRGTAVLFDVAGLRVVGGTPGATDLLVPVRHGNHEEFQAAIRLVVQ